MMFNARYSRCNSFVFLRQDFERFVTTHVFHLCNSQVASFIPVLSHRVMHVGSFCGQTAQRTKDQEEEDPAVDLLVVVTILLEVVETFLLLSLTGK